MKDVGDKTGFIPTFFHSDHSSFSIAGTYLRGIDNLIEGTLTKYFLMNANTGEGLGLPVLIITE